MPEYLAPGVYVEEISTGPKPIEGVSTSVAGFLGPTERGPEDIQYISSWIEFQRVYGGHMGIDPPNGTFMTYGVQGFFDNGGKRCFVGRIVKDRAGDPAFKAFDNLLVRAIGRGTWGNRVYLRFLKAKQREKGTPRAVAENWVRVQIAYFSTQPPVDPPVDFTDPTTSTDANRRTPDLFEDFDNLSPIPGAANSVITAINQGSNLVRVEFKPSAAPIGLTTTFQKLGGGDDGPPGDLLFTDYTGNTNLLVQGANPPDLLGQGRGLAAMDLVNEVSLLVAPDHVKFNDDLSQMLVTDCERLRDRFAILSADQNFYAKVKGGTARPSIDTTFGAFYYPWIKVYDPYIRDDIYIPPAGHVTGLIANTDIQIGVHKAPANAVLVGAKDLQNPVPKADQDNLNPVGVNCIRDFRSDGRGIRVWGARTMTSDPEWKYVNVRRLFLMIEESIDEGTQWVVFEPNAPVTWARVVRAITNFLTTLWRNGALFGATPAEAFFVKCDRTTMTDDDIENGRLICYVGVAPVRPAEFVIIRIGQKTADAQS
jgi:phage tail sheath protein FI